MKSIFHSRTFWIAVIQAIASVAIVVLTELDLIGWVGFVKSFVDILLRVDTSTPVDISLSGENK